MLFAWEECAASRGAGGLLNRGERSISWGDKGFGGYRRRLVVVMVAVGGLTPFELTGLCTHDASPRTDDARKAQIDLGQPE